MPSRLCFHGRITAAVASCLLCLNSRRGDTHKLRLAFVYHAVLSFFGERKLALQSIVSAH